MLLIFEIFCPNDFFIGIFCNLPSFYQGLVGRERKTLNGIVVDQFVRLLGVKPKPNNVLMQQTILTINNEFILLNADYQIDSKDFDEDDLETTNIPKDVAKDIFFFAKMILILMRTSLDLFNKAGLTLGSNFTSIGRM